MRSFFAFFIIFQMALNSKEYYLKTESYLEEILSERNRLEIAKAYYFLHKDNIALIYLDEAKDNDFLTKAKLYAKLGKRENAIEAVKKYIYNKKFDFKFNYFEELKEILNLIGIDEEIKKLGKFEKIVISYVNSNNFEKIFNIFPRNRKEIIKILLEQKNLNYQQELLIFRESSIEDIASYLFNNIKSFYDYKGYFRYFDFLENESIVKLKTVLEEIIYYIYRNDTEQAIFVFNKELKKSKTSLEKYMLHMVMHKDFEDSFEFPSDRYFYLYIKQLKEIGSTQVLKFLDLFLDKYKESKYLTKVLEINVDFVLDKIKFLDEILEKNFSDRLFDKKLQLLAQSGRADEYKASLEQLIKKFPIPRYVKMLEDIKGVSNLEFKKESQDKKTIQKDQDRGYKKQYDEALYNFNNNNYEKCFETLESIIEDNTIDYNLINLYLKVCYKLNFKNKLREINKKYFRIINWYER